MRKAAILFFILFTVHTANVSAQEKYTFTYCLGDAEIILLSENQGDGNKGILIDAPAHVLEKYIPEGTFPNAVNTFLYKSPQKTVLFDTGFGTRLFDHLENLGIKPADINEVIITHMHGDHIGGLLREGGKSFPDAKLKIGRVEKDYWASDENMKKVPERNRGSFLKAQEVLEKYRTVLELVDDFDINNVPAGDGIYPIRSYGHTPGHLSFMIVNGGKQLLIWGDLTHAMAVQMPHPEIAVTYDVDPETAVKSRREILGYVSENGIPIAGMHIAYPGIGTVNRNGEEGYTFTPAE